MDFYTNQYVIPIGKVGGEDSWLRLFDDSQNANKLSKHMKKDNHMNVDPKSIFILWAVVQILHFYTNKYIISISKLGGGLCQSTCIEKMVDMMWW